MSVKSYGFYESKRQKKSNQWKLYAMILTFDGEYYCNQNVFLTSVLLKNMKSEYAYFQVEVPTKFEFISVCWMSLNCKSSDSSGPHNVGSKTNSISIILEMQILGLLSRSTKSRTLVLRSSNSTFYQALETIWYMLKFDNHCLSMVKQRPRAWEKLEPQRKLGSLAWYSMKSYSLKF